LGLFASKHTLAQYGRLRHWPFVKSLVKKQTTIKVAAKDEGSVIEKRMAKPAVEGGNDGFIQEVRVDRGAAHRSCRVSEPESEFLPMIMHIIIQQ
jgi:hypothetical protein